MNKIFINKPIGQFFIISLQILILMIYFYINIISVGDFGGGEILLVSFFFLSFCTLFIKIIKYDISIYKHFLFFLIFSLWLIFRTLIDLNDINQLKQITIGTTGGVILFYFLGSLLRDTLDYLNYFSRKIIWISFFFSLILFIFIYFSYSGRLMDIDILRIDDINGGYQRAGNFIIIFYLLFSYLFVMNAANDLTKSKLNFYFFNICYIFSLLLLILSSQMIGSNAATINLLMIYIISTIISSIAFDSNVRVDFVNNQLTLLKSKVIFKKIILKTILFLFLFLFFMYILIVFTGFDVNTTRAFGYGGENRSIASRFEIFQNYGFQQLSYAPFFGNMNVAYLITGDSGKTLHYFIPNLIAELGILGLIIFLSLIFVLIRVIKNKIKKLKNDMFDFKLYIINIWFFLILSYLLVYINFSVGKSWSVLWFFIGLSSGFFVLCRKKI